MAKNTLELLENISMQLKDITDKMQNAKKKERKKGGSEKSSSIFSGTTSIFKELKGGGKEMKSIGEGLAELGKGLLEMKKAGKPEKVEKYLKNVVEFVKNISKIGSDKVLKESANINKSVANITKALTGLFKVLTVKKALSIWIASHLLTKKTGERIGKFYSALIKEAAYGVKKGDKKFIQGLVDMVKGVAEFIKVSALVLAGLVLIVMFKPKALIGGMAALLVLIGMAIGAIWALKKIFEKEKRKDIEKTLKAFSNALKSLAISVAILAAVALLATFIPMKGMLIMVVILGIAIGAMWLIAKIMKEKGKDIQKGIIGFVILLGSLVIALAILRLMVKNNRALQQTLLGILLLVVIIGIMIITMKLLGKQEFQENLIKAVAAMVVMTAIFVVIAITIKKLIIPIGKQWVATLVGLLAMAAIIGGFIWIIKKLGDNTFIKDMARAQKGVVLMLELMLVMIGVAVAIWIVSKAFKDSPVAATVATLVLAAIMVGLAYFGKLLVKAMKGLKIPRLMQAAQWLLVMSGILLIVSLAVGLIALIFTKITKTWSDRLAVAFGIALIAATIWGLATLGKAIQGVGKAIKITDLLKGALVVGLVGGLMVLLAWVFTILVDMFKKIDDYGWLKLGLGLLGIIAYPTLFGVLVMGIGALVMGPQALALAVGAAVLIALGGIILLLGFCISYVVDVLKKIDATGWDKDEFEERAKLAADALLAFIDPFVGLGTLIKIGLMLATAIPTILGLSAAMVPLRLMYWGMFSILKSFADFLRKLGMSPEDLADDNNGFVLLCKSLASSFVDFFTTVADGLSDIGILTAMIANIVSGELMPVLAMVSLFIDVVEKVATMKVIIGYDENGNPRYRQLPPTVFVDSAKAIADGFWAFFPPLAAALLIIGPIAAGIMAFVSIELLPVIYMVSQFIDIVEKVATLQIVTGYDENGNPEFRRLPATVFVDSAKAIGNGFLHFFSRVSLALLAIGPIAAGIMAFVAVELMPVMDMMSKFVDVIIQMATAHYIEDWDVVKVTGQDGKETAVLKPVYGEIPCVRGGNNWAEDAAITVAEGFGFFVNTLGQSLQSIRGGSFLGFTWGTVATMEVLAETIGPIMDGVSAFVDSIIKLATASYIKGYDENGKPIYEKLPPGWAEKSAITIVATFGMFLTSLAEAVNDIEDDAIEAMESLKEVLGPVMESVGNFSEALIKLGQNQYPIVGYDEKGNPIYDLKHPIDWNDLGRHLASTYIDFIVSFAEEAKENEEIISEAEDSMQVLSEVMSPLMDGLSKYATAIEKLLKSVGGEEGMSGEDALWMKLADLGEAATRGIYSLFHGEYGLSLSNLKDWGMDDEDGVEVYKNFQKIIKCVSECINSLVSSLNPGEGHASLENLSETGAAAVICIHDLFYGDYGLRPSKLRDWGMDDDYTIDLYKNFSKVLSIISKCISQLMSIGMNNETFTNLGDVGAAATKCIYDLFHGEYGLRPNNLRHWDFDYDYTVDLYKNFYKVLNIISKCIKSLAQSIKGIHVKELEGAGEVMAKCIYDLFHGDTGLSPSNLDDWGMDDEDCIDLYKNLYKATLFISKSVEKLANIYNTWTDGETRKDKTLQEIMVNLMSCIRIWANHDLYDAVRNLKTILPQLLNCLTQMVTGFRGVRAEVGAVGNAFIRLNRTLQDVIVTKNNARIQALNKLEESFNKVSKSVDKVKESILDLSKQDFETLSQNINMVAEAFMQAFEEHNAANATDNPNEFLNAAANGDPFTTSINGNTSNGMGTNGNTPGSRGNQGNGQNGSTYVPVPQSTYTGSRNITVYFGTKAFHGRIELN